MRLVALLITRATTLAYPDLLPELIGCLQDRKLRVLVSLLDHESDGDRALSELEGLRLDGIVAAVRPSDATLAATRRRGVPMLLYNCHAEQPATDSVSCDHVACGQVLASLLLAAGHRRFGIIASPEDSVVGRERVTGAVDVLKGAGISAFAVEAGDYTYQSGVAAFDALLARMKPRPSAIISANDAMAMGALDRARALRIRVPRDLSVVGIDGTMAAGLPAYQLTTVRQPLALMARAAAEVLINAIETPGHPPEIRLFAGELIRGLTSRPDRPRRLRRAAASLASTRRRDR